METGIWIYIPRVRFIRLETCKGERDSLTVKFFDGATCGWQEKIDIFAALLTIDPIRRTDFRGTPLSLANFISRCRACTSWIASHGVYPINIKNSFSFVKRRTRSTTVLFKMSSSISLRTFEPAGRAVTKNRIGPITTFSRTRKT